MSNERILVTGGAGFIGSHLVPALLGLGHEVVVLDDLSTGKRENVPGDNRARLVIGSVADAEAVRKALTGCTAFVHLAAIASVQKSVEDPISTNHVNLRGSIRLFHEAALLGVTRGLYASSAAVYGDSNALPIRESTCGAPRSPYAADKLAGEHYLGHFHRAGLINATTFRFFNVFGPRQDPKSPYSGVVSIFMDKASAGEELTIFGDGSQTRDFIYVEDVVAALLAALAVNRVSEDMDIYNVARGEAVSLIDLVGAIEGLPAIHSPLRVVHAPPRQGDIQHSRADTSRLRSDLAWSPRVSIHEGLSRLLSMK